VTLGRMVGAAALLGLAWLAVFGGEYSVRDWWLLKAQVAAERDSLSALRMSLDSLEQVARALETDPRAQERAAREQFGMIRPGEIIYRLVPGKDSGQ